MTVSSDRSARSRRPKPSDWLREYREESSLTKSDALQHQKPQMRGHEGVVDQLGGCKDTLRPDPCGERKRVDLLLDLLLGFTLHRSDTSGEYYGVSSEPNPIRQFDP